MKKIMVMMVALALTIVTANAAENIKPANSNQTVQLKAIDKKMMRDNAFEKRLELTEVQKLKARQIRQSGHEKLRPVIEQIKTKKQEAEMIRRSRMAVQMQEEKLSVIDDELRILEKQANEIRRANMKEFESILTRQQKKTLKQMKKEGRQKYHSAHPINMPKIMPPQGLYPKQNNITK